MEKEIYIFFDFGELPNSFIHLMENMFIALLSEIFVSPYMKMIDIWEILILCMKYIGNNPQNGDPQNSGNGR
jgi:hypothetical protein